MVCKFFAAWSLVIGAAFFLGCDRVEVEPVVEGAVEVGVVDVMSFNIRYGSADDGAKIDFIFTQASAEVLDAAIVRDNVDGRYASDHFAVTAKILFGK